MDRQALLDAYLADPDLPLAPAIEAEQSRQGGDVDLVIVDVALALLRQADMAAAERWVIRATRDLDFTNARFLAAVWAMADRDVAFLSSDLFDQYLRDGGEDREAHEFAISRYFVRGDHDRVRRTYRRAKRWFDPLTMNYHALFSSGVCLMDEGDAAGAMAIFGELHRRDPSDEILMGNISNLARYHGVPEAIALYRAKTESLVKALPAYADDEDTRTSVVVDLARQSVEDVRRALERRGLCHVKGGCDPTVAETILARIQQPDHAAYPATLHEDVTAALPSLFRFDARQLAADSLGRPVELDPKSSTVRKVDPSDADSFTPFHQDVTAFQRMLVNVWTPLTRAGGDYPTVQFVAKRIQHVEQTMLSRPGYNLIAIEEETILEKYGDLLYEATDVAPGDCVIFYGTTIHRSTNLEQATKPRFNLEIRWT